MYVIKRDGRKQEVKFDKVTSRIQRLCYGLDAQFVDPIKISLKVIEGIYDGVTTSELDNLAAEVAALLAAKHPDYALLAARIAVSNLHKNTLKSFSDTIELFHNASKAGSKKLAPMISEELYQVVSENKELIDGAIIYDRDFGYDYFGFKTLERSYLLKINGKTMERPQHLIMRVAIGIHGKDIKRAIETYNGMSERFFTHATPTLFNAGLPNPQMSSCFLLQMKEDSIDGIFETLKDCAKISQSAGGIGVSIHNIRATGSYIKGTGGISNGIIPMLRVFNDTARYVDQGGGKRKGSFAVYLEPWHADVYHFLDLRKNTGKEEMRARDLFLALWVPDLFMKRVEANENWSLFCPNEAPGLDDCFGKAFEELYMRYEEEGRARKTVKAQDLWFKILEAQTETGSPYILYKDACNQKSNQQNIGTIKSSNLCAEIVEYTSPSEIAVCNLASIALPKFVKNGEFDHQKLYEVVQIVTRNLDTIIEKNSYPVAEAKTSNMRHRPIGIGVQGLADLFVELNLPFESEDAKKINIEVFETLYYSALSASVQIAKEKGPYATFSGSPLSRGQLQCDLWGVTPGKRWDFPALREEVKKHGARNSLLVALMPTASTSQILGNTESFEPRTSNLFSRRVLSGEFVVVNKYLMRDLVKLGLWSEDMKQKIMAHNGSIEKISEIPAKLKELYKTVWEIKQKTIIDMAADRGPYVCQSQSLNIFMEEASINKLTAMHFYGWKKGLKTGMYYLRTKASVDPIKFTVEETLRRKVLSREEKEAQKSADEEESACPIDGSCLTCSA